MKALIEELKTKIIETLDLVDLSPQDITDDAPFFQQEDGLGLDSVDVLEMVVMLEKQYGVRIDSRELGEKVFVNMTTLAQYITEHRAK